MLRKCELEGCDNLGEGRGGGKRRRLCAYHRRPGRHSDRLYRFFKQDVCVRCGFVPEHPVQLDVDHINGIKQDNRPENLQTLCANCHRLKTWEAGEFIA